VHKRQDQVPPTKEPSENRGCWKSSCVKEPFQNRAVGWVLALKEPYGGPAIQKKKTKKTGFFGKRALPK